MLFTAYGNKLKKKNLRFGDSSDSAKVTIVIILITKNLTIYSIINWLWQVPLDGRTCQSKIITNKGQPISE